MARESPQLATKMCVGVTSAVIAVLPLWSSRFRTWSESSSSLSSLRKPSRSASRIFSGERSPDFHAAVAVICSRRPFAASSLMYLPPCPSKTPKKL